MYVAFSSFLSAPGPHQPLQAFTISKQFNFICHETTLNQEKQSGGRKLCTKLIQIPQFFLLTYLSNILFVPIRSPLDRLEILTEGS